MATNQRKLEGYADVSEAVLSKASIIRAISHKEVMGDISKGETLKVYVHDFPTLQDYVPGTGVAPTTDGSSYVTLNNLKDKVVNEVLDGLSVDKAYNDMDYVAGRLVGGLEAFAKQMDIDGLAKMAIDGVEFVAAGGLKPTILTIYSDILALAEQLDDQEAPDENRSLVLTPEMNKLILSNESKIKFDGTPAGYVVVQTGFLGFIAGFAVYKSTRLPVGTNMIALQERGFAHTDDWTITPYIQSLDGSEKHVGDSALKGREAYNNGAIRPTLIQVNNGAL